MLMEEINGGKKTTPSFKFEMINGLIHPHPNHPPPHPNHLLIFSYRSQCKGYTDNPDPYSTTFTLITHPSKSPYE